MSKVPLVTTLQQRIDVAKQERRTTLPLSSLEELLASESKPEATTQTSGDLGADSAEESHARAWDLALMERGLEALASTLKSAILINGGAAVALLAFFGNLAGSTRTAEVAISFEGLRRALLFFVVGVAAAGVANVPQYAMVLFGRKEQSAAAGLTSLIVLLLAALSFAAFVGGGLYAFWAVR